MVKRYRQFFRSDADGLRISALSICPEEMPYKGVIQLVHGMSEHKERYEPFMEYMASLGYVAVIHDHRGHGQSVRSGDDLGYMCGSPSNRRARIAGSVIAKLEGKLFGMRHRSRLLEILSFGNYAARFSGEKNRNAWICSDPEVYQAYTDSELCGFTFTDDAYLALFQLMKRAYDVKHWNCTKPELPVLFISGADDPCLGNVRQFAAAVQKMRDAGYRDVKGKLYPGMRHEILNEKDRERVFRDISVYIRKKGF